MEDGLRQRRIPFALYPTEGPGHARELAAGLARDGVKRILVVGGDGTVHEVANGILSEDAPRPALAVAPTGTGNDFYRMVGAPRSLGAALDLLQTGVVEYMDVGRVRFGGRETHFVNLLGVGLDVEVLRGRARFRRLPGLLQYLGALLAALVAFRGFGVEVDLGALAPPFSGSTLFSGLTLGPSVGGGFLISPGASPHDGLFDFFLVEPLTAVKVARYLPRVIRGTHEGIPEFHLRKVVSARFARTDGEPLFFELDGEVMPDPITELEAEVRPGMLPVIVPGAKG